MRGVRIDLTNKKYGLLTVIESTSERKDNSVVWKCLCDCGNIKYINTKHLNRGQKSCGCINNLPNKAKGRPWKGKSLVGQVYGFLTVVEFKETNKHQHKVWKCICKCGKEHFATTNSLNRKKSSSCGCNHYKSGKETYNYKGYQDITGTKWHSISYGAKIRNLDFTITKEFIWELLCKQNHLCYYSSVPISFKNKTASVDRIDSKLGYTESNVVIVHKYVNRMKSDFDQYYFIDMCKKIYLTDKNKKANAKKQKNETKNLFD